MTFAWVEGLSQVLLGTVAMFLLMFYYITVKGSKRGR